MRKLTSHKVNGCNEAITIVVLDEPGSGGANHEYEIHYPESGINCLRFSFQNGPIKEAGVNGITHEALLAILEDRLVGFQNGSYACDANAKALTFIRAAQDVLHSRTLERVVRGVEGTHTV
jgi:hypothetical protein